MIKFYKLLEDNVPSKVEEDCIIFTDKGSIYVSMNDGSLLKMCQSNSISDQFIYDMSMTTSNASKFSNSTLYSKVGGGISFTKDIFIDSIDVVAPHNTNISECKVFICSADAILSTGLNEEHIATSELASTSINNNLADGSKFTIVVNKPIPVGYILWINVYGSGMRAHYASPTVYPSTLKGTGYNWNGVQVYSDDDTYPMVLKGRYK